jgi:hypothetical protein
MASIYETVMVDILARLKASGSGWVPTSAVRRAHRTIVPRDGTPAVHLVDGEDAPARRGTQRDCARREGAFTVSIFVRSDAGVGAADPFKIEVMRRLSPDTQAYAAGVTIQPGRIAHDVEIADLDAVRVDMDFGIRYTAQEWSLT